MNRIEDKSLNELIDSYLSEDGVEIYDKVIDRAKRRTGRVKALCWSAAGLVAAACIAMFILPASQRQDGTPTITSVQIAEGIRHIIELDLGDVETISAKPMGDKAMLTTTLRDGSTYTYIMTCNEDDGSASIIAFN